MLIKKTFCVHSKVVVLFLLVINCLLLLPLFVGVLCLVLVQYIVSFLVCNHLAEEERAVNSLVFNVFRLLVFVCLICFFTYHQQSFS